MTGLINEKYFYWILLYCLGFTSGILYIVLVQWWKRNYSRGKKRLQKG